MSIKRGIAILLVFCLSISNVYAAQVAASPFDTMGEWFKGASETASKAAEGISSAASEAGKSISSVASEAGKTISSVASEAGKSISSAASEAGSVLSSAASEAGKTVAGAASSAGQALSQAASESSKWMGEAFGEASQFVSSSWKTGSKWATSSWSGLMLWADTLVSGNPYSWMQDLILSQGLLAYEQLAEMRSFLRENPDEAGLKEKYLEILSSLSILNEDRDLLWELMQVWSNVKKTSLTSTATLALPFLVRLTIEGESAIGEDVVFSGSVISQYLITILDAMKVNSQKVADKKIKILNAAMEKLTRPTVLGDAKQNVLVTTDGLYLESFSYLEGKYQILMLVSQKDASSPAPLLRGKTLEEWVKHDFPTAKVESVSAPAPLGKNMWQSVDFEYILHTDTEEPEFVRGCEADELQSRHPNRIDGVGTEFLEGTIKARGIALYAESRDYLFYLFTNGEWNEEEVQEWFSSITSEKDQIQFTVDVESDGAFDGINQTSQRYTINRIFDEEKFTVPYTGHGWAAEEGNNLIDNIKGVFKGEHAKVIGGDNMKDGPDRLITYADGTREFIQSKYCSTASRSISACFRDGKLRYMTANNTPMAIEVPADQYEAAIEYMQNHIRNGEVEGITDPADAFKIVKKGNLTYQQAKHIAKAGTVESILYDSAQACVTGVTAFGLSTAFEFALGIWSGQRAEEALKASVFQGLKNGGITAAISVFSTQLAKSGLNTAMIPASRAIVHAMGPKASALLVNAFRPAGSAIYGAAAMQSAAKLLRGNVITSAVSFVILSTVDVADILRGRISPKQLAKNLTSTAAGVTGGTLGYIGGAALGVALIPGAPVVAGAAGLILSVAAGWGAHEGASAITSHLGEDDAEEMLEIITSEFTSIVTEYFLNEEEVNLCITNLQSLLTPGMLKEMYGYKNHEEFARQLIEMSIDPVVAEREFIELPDEETYSQCIAKLLMDSYKANESIWKGQEEEKPFFGGITSLYRAGYRTAPGGENEAGADETDVQESPQTDTQADTQADTQEETQADTQEEAA